MPIMLQVQGALDHDRERRHLALALAVGGIGTWDVDIVQRVATVSDRVAMRYGPNVRTSLTLTLEEWRQRIHPEDRDDVVAAIEKFFAGEMDYDTEYRVVSEDGTVHWIAVKGAIVESSPETGQPLRAVGVSRNITAKKTAETERLVAAEALRRSEQEKEEVLNQLRLAMRVARLGTWELDGQSFQILTSENTDFIYGVLPLPASRTRDIDDYLDRVHPEDVDQVRQSALDALAQGGELSVEYRILRQDGTVRWVVSRGKCLPHLVGEGKRMVGALVDITEQKRAEQKLRESEAQLRALFENAREAIGIAFRGRILYVNPAYARLLGYDSPEEMIGLPSVETVAPSDIPRMQEMARRRASNEEVPDLYGYRGVKKDGTEVDLENYVATYMVDGEQYTIVTTRDISERLRAMEEIQKLNARLQQAMTETHHRVKNNLQMISSLLELSTMNGNETVPVAEITSLTQHLRSLAAIHDLMTLEARHGDGLDMLDARAILEKLLPGLQTVTGLNGRLTFQAENAQITSRQATSLALITNELVTNAVKHGASIVEVLLASEGNRARLEVRDNGPGFPEEFDPIRSAHTGLDLVQNLTMWDLRGSAHFGNQLDGGGLVVLHIPLTLLQE
jgi:PAS domain S-box-containing protein